MGISINGRPSALTDIVFAYDLKDGTQYKGEPTTNIANTTGGTVDWTVTNLTGSVSRSTIENGIRYQITSTTGGSFRILFDVSKLTNGATYTMSYKFKIISGGPTFDATDWCDTVITRVTTDFGDYVYKTATGTRGTYDSVYRFMDFTISANSVIEIWDVQLEEKDYATPFTQTNRGDTESLLPVINTENAVVDLSNTSFINGFPDGSNSAVTDPDWINLPNNDYIFNNGESHTFETVAKRTVLGGNSLSIYTGRSITNPFISNSYVTASSFRLQYREFSTGTYYNSTTLTDSGYLNSYYHIVVVVEPGQVSFYINGQAYGTGSISNTYFNYQKFMGGYSSGGNYYPFVGVMPLVRVYGVALTQEEITNNYNQLKSRFSLG